MPLRYPAALAVLTLIATPAAVRGQGGGAPGCSNLPEYNRALGALQGMTSACDMSLEEACRIVAARGISAAACQPAAPQRRGRKRADP